MAKFNPDVPQTDAPNYFGYSQPISQPDGDKTVATAITGIGNLIEQGVKATDFVIKDTIDKAVNAGADTISGIFTAGLETLAGRDTDGSLLPANTQGQAAPYDVRNSGNSAGLLRQAAEAGKLTPTSYYGKLMQLAKDLRAQHPGYRDYIDQQISQATGIHPANAYMKSLMSDINALQTKSAGDTETKTKYILQHDPALYKEVVTGNLPLDVAMVKASERAAVLAEATMRKTLREDNNGARGDQDAQAKDDAQFQASTEARRYIDNISISAGLEHPMTAKQILDGLNSGALKLDETQSRLMMGELLAKKAEYVRSMTNWFNTASPGKLTPAQMLKGGMEDANKIIAQNASAFDEILKPLADKDFGAAYAQGSLFKARVDAAKLGLISDPSIGYDFTLTAAARDIGGDQFVVGVAKQSMLGDFDTKWKAYYERQTKLLGTQTTPQKQSDGSYKAVPNDVPKTLKSVVDDALAKGMNQASFYDKMVDYVGNFTDKNNSDGVKFNLMRAVYSEGNNGILNRFPDRVDPATGKVVNNQYSKESLFSKFTSPQSLSEVKRISDKNDPSLWRNAKDWAETEFSREIFSRDIQSLNNYTDTSAVQLTWNTERHEWKLEPKKSLFALSPSEEALKASNSAGYKEAQRRIDRLNEGIRGIVNIAKVDGSDPDAYVIGLMVQAGYQPNQNTPGLPQKMIDALKAAHADASFADTIKKSADRVPQGSPSMAKK